VEPSKLAKPDAIFHADIRIEAAIVLGFRGRFFGPYCLEGLAMSATPSRPLPTRGYWTQTNLGSCILSQSSKAIPMVQTLARDGLRSLRLPLGRCWRQVDALMPCWHTGTRKGEISRGDAPRWRGSVESRRVEPPIARSVEWGLRTVSW